MKALLVSTKDLALLVIWFVVVLSVAVSGRCLCPKECDCEDNLARCTNILEIPSCLPPKIKALIVDESPFFTSISNGDFKNDYNLTELRIRNTGLTTIEQHAFVRNQFLQVLEISSASYLNNVTKEMFSGLFRLTELTISGCKQWTSVGLNIFISMPELQHLDISSNGFQILPHDSFYGLTNLLSLNLSENKGLTNIPQYSFSGLNELQDLRINDCNLQVLYPEYVETSYNNGSLHTFLAQSNDWRCELMCDFFQWLDRNPGFRAIGNVALGSCTSPPYLQNNFLIALNADNVCFNYIVSWVVFLGLLGSVVIAVFCCFFMATKNCCSGLCGSGSGTRSAALQPQTRSRGHVNQSSELNDDAISQEYGASVEMGNWRITDIDPPSYDTVVKQEGGDEISLDSMAGISPPVYEEINSALETEASTIRSVEAQF